MFFGTTSVSDFSSPVPLRFVLLRSAVLGVRAFLSCPLLAPCVHARDSRRASDFFSRASRPAFTRGDEISQVPVAPPPTRPALRPRWSLHTHDPRVLRCCFRSANGVGLHDVRPFGAQSHGSRACCLRFAVVVTHARRKTRFRLVVSLFRAGCTAPPGASEGFSDVALHFIESSFHRLGLAHSPSPSRSTTTTVSGPAALRCHSADGVSGSSERPETSRWKRLVCKAHEHPA